MAVCKINIIPTKEQNNIANTDLIINTCMLYA